MGLNVSRRGYSRDSTCRHILYLTNEDMAMRGSNGGADLLGDLELAPFPGSGSEIKVCVVNLLIS